MSHADGLIVGRMETLTMNKSLCTIQRTKKVTRGTMNIATGQFTWKAPEIVTEPCSTPLFYNDECATGICRSCKHGWEAEGNIFASQEERKRATS